MNSADTHEANSKAMSLCANVPPVRPALLFIPIAPVASIHLLGDRVKLFVPASFLKVSNSTPLKLGLFILSHSPKNSIVARVRSQFFYDIFGFIGIFYSGNISQRNEVALLNSCE